MRPAGVILAGGLARRMGGGDKCLVPLGHAPMLTHIIARLRPQVDALALNANGDPTRFAAFNLPVLPDPLPDNPGPLAGILAGLTFAQAQGASHVVSVAGDTPFFPADLVARLSAASAPIALAATREDGTVRRHPTFGLWPVSAADDLLAALHDGVRKVVVFADAVGAETVVFDDDDPFFNVNRPEDLEAAEARLLDEPS
ncbi:MAG: molybdenum cofactor guanylyltransferase MobA [Pseudomonadota bacterium]